MIDTAAAKEFQTVVVSSPELIAGATYNVDYGGGASGAARDGLCEDGTYSGGTRYTSFTISSVVTWLGAAGGFGGGPGGGEPGGRRP